MALKKIAIAFYNDDLEYPDIMVNPNQKKLSYTKKNADYLVLIDVDIPEPPKAPCVVFDLTKKGKK